VEFLVKYDVHSLDAAAKTLFLHRWYPLFPWIAACLTTSALFAGAISYALSGPTANTAIFLSLGISSAVASLFAFSQHRRRMLKRSGETARIELDEDVVRIDSVRGTAEIPWKSVVQIVNGVPNVLLFVSRGAAIVIPAASIPAEALELVERKRREFGRLT
jgi:hypothetical protein